MSTPSAEPPRQDGEMDRFYAHGLLWVLTCSACPEQYDVYYQHDPVQEAGRLEQVAYLRLRHGRFAVSCPDYGGAEVYSAAPEGDGMFEEDERAGYIRKAAKRIHAWMGANAVKSMWDRLSERERGYGDGPFT